MPIITTPDPLHVVHDLPKDYARIMMELGQDALDYSGAGEVLLLHGTAPTNLHNILFQGLDPEVARNGKFGRGVYFAENAAKIDEYATLDKMFEKNGPLTELHAGLYHSCLHPKRVRYCLVARVVLGRHVVRTNNGTTQLLETAGRSSQQQQQQQQCSKKDIPLFSNSSRSQLTNIAVDAYNSVQPSSLVAECGELNPSFREFVVFHPDQIFIEYVIAYHRVRRYCDCNEPIVKRTVTKEGSVNRGREIHLCNKNNHSSPSASSSSSSCGYMRMLPLCDCGQSATIKTSHTAKNPGRQYYTCHGKSCDYFGWCGETSSHGTTGSPYKKQKNEE